jgi:polysaccharide export outer membrane protein
MLRLSNPLSTAWNFAVALGILACLQAVVSAQNSTNPPTAQRKPGIIERSPAENGSPGEPDEQKPAPQYSPPAVVIGPGDELEIAVYGAPDLSEHTRVSPVGNIWMPLIGDVRVAGLSNTEAEGAIGSQLRRNNILNDPQVSVYVKEYTNSGISVAGEVTKPGFYSAVGRHSLFDILQVAGGLTEKAANTVNITHRGSEVPVTVQLPKDPSELSQIKVELIPGDTVVVARAGIVYVLGEVLKPGGYVLNSSGGVTLLQVVAAAGGPIRGAAVGRTKMLRRTPNGLQELPVPLKALLHAKVPDIAVQAEDIIYVPGSRSRAALATGATLGTTLATVAFYRVPF